MRTNTDADWERRSPGRSNDGRRIFRGPLRDAPGEPFDDVIPV
jgi:hypothetical protein